MKLAKIIICAFLILVLAVTIDRFATRPALVSWVSPPLEANNGHRVKLLIPAGWKTGLNGSSYDIALEPDPEAHPKWMSWLYPKDAGRIAITVRVPGYHAKGPLDQGHPENHEVVQGHYSFIWRSFLDNSPRGKLFVFMDYIRPNQAAFNATHTTICQSLTIE